jgi:MFS family permease
MRFAGLWRNNEFLKLWTAETVSVFGSMVSGAALSFTAILFLNASPAQLGLLKVADLLPKFLAGLIAGVWVDRLRRRPIMIAADLGRALLLGAIPAAALLHRLRIEQLYAVTFLTGLLTLFFDVANRSYLPTLIPREALVEGNSKLTASASVAEFGAFSLAGWLVQWLTGPIAVLVDAVSFLFSALFLGMIGTPEPPPIPHAERQGMREEVVEGLRVVLQDRILLSLAVTTLILSLAGGMISTVIVAFMTRTLGFKPGVLGMIWAVGGVTSMLGAIAAGPLARRLGTGPALALGLFCSSVGFLLVPLARGATLLSGALLVGNQMITDPAHTVYEINQRSLRQAIAPDRVLGRVNASLEFVGLGANLLGALAGGWLGGKIGLRATLFAAAGGSLLAALWLFLSPVWRVRKVVACDPEGVGRAHLKHGAGWSTPGSERRRYPARLILRP